MACYLHFQKRRQEVMAVRTILRMGDPRLLQSAAPVRDFAEPALQALMVSLFVQITGSSDLMKIFFGFDGGKTCGSNRMVSPSFTSKSAWRRVPGPLSSALVTVITFKPGVGGALAGVRVAAGALGILSGVCEVSGALGV